MLPRLATAKLVLGICGADEPWLNAHKLIAVGTVVIAWLRHQGSHSRGMTSQRCQMMGPPMRKDAWKNTFFTMFLCFLNMRTVSMMAYPDKVAPIKTSLCRTVKRRQTLWTHLHTSLRKGKKKSTQALTSAKRSCAKRSVTSRAAEKRNCAASRALYPLTAHTCQPSHPNHAMVPAAHVRGRQTATKCNIQKANAMQTPHAKRSGTSSSGTDARQRLST
mmetsp:Transcript_20409/g.56385  ORF Transcript_20409/g.56385 Transcript_20409/m.56385 type:complete len:219 (+) Transcript_20409:60-716(+)